MNGFALTFLNEDWNAQPRAARFYLCAFGKHPGWNDHLDDIGVGTSSLILARRSIYGGIAHQIESATWQKIAHEKVSPGFDHVLQWSRMGETIIGLLWSSQDGKGRSLYPMITLAHCVGQPYDWVAGTVLPTIERMAVQCRDTTVAETVVSLLNRNQHRLRSLAPIGFDNSLSQVGVPAWAAYFTQHPEGLRRVLHFIRAQLSAFAPGSRAWCDCDQACRSSSVRLPRIPGSSAAESLNAWISFFSTQLDSAVPLLGLLSREGTWLDLIIGEPSPADFFVLRALPEAVPLVTEVPYQLDLAMQASLLGLFDDLASGRVPGRSCFEVEAADSNREQAAAWLRNQRPSEKTGFFGRLFKLGKP